MTLLLILLWAGLLLWTGLLLWAAGNLRRYPMVAASQDFALSSHPRISILIPARNEARILARTLPKVLEQDYDPYEVILVDDASTDGTGELAAKLQRLHPDKLRLLRVEKLPAGWVGKTHALHQGFQAATGDWVLATDADIVLHPKALQAGMWLAERQQAELVSIFAFMECVSFWERVILPGFGLLLSILFPLRKINDPRSSVALASGGYLLMRRSLWAKLGGYEAIRSEMIDDLNTARRVKHAGHRIYAAATKDLVRTRMYSNLRGIWEGLRKNAFAGHRYSVAKLLASGSAYWLCNVLPVASALYFLGRWAVLGVRPGESEVVAMALSLAQCAMAVAIHLPIVRFLAIPPGYALLAPLGAILYTAISLDSMARTLFGRGVSWKERAYRRPEAEFGGEPG